MLSLDSNDIVKSVQLLTEEGVKVKLDTGDYVKITLTVITAVIVSSLAIALIKSLFNK